jgi:hypothetical protein
LIVGDTDNLITFTLANGAGPTVVTDPTSDRITPGTVIVPIPIHANCAGDVIDFQTATVVAGLGQVTFTHNNRAVANRDYIGIIVGS